MIAQELEVTLHMAFVEAREKRHEIITVEHLLFALLDNFSAAAVLRGCGANMDALRKGLTQHIARNTNVVAAGRDVDTQPTSGFQRVIQRAILNVQSAGKKEVIGTDVLRAIFGEKDCHAERLLRQQSITAVDVANYVSLGITKAPQSHVNQVADSPPPIASEPPSAPIEGPLDDELDATLHTAYLEARQKRHEFITVEHLLHALLDNPNAAEILRACGANAEVLRKKLDQHIAEHTPLVAGDREVDTQPTLGFQRVIQRAILHGQAAARKEVNGAHVLVAIFGEKDSHAVYFLHQQGVTRLAVTTFVAHGVVSLPPSSTEGAAAEDMQIVLYNDESTPMEFLATVLQEFFAMSKEDAAETMLEVYRDGKAVCGLYSREDAEMLVRQVRQLADQRGQPLRCEAHLAKVR
jgi:ATP-dependent Clp protease ATP-binding subunit ClpA